MAHKLPVTISSYVSAENLREGQDGCVSIVEDRQYNGSCLYQQSRRDSIQTTGLLDQGLVNVVTGEEQAQHLPGVLID